MKKLLNKKANIFGKKVPVFVIALIAVIGLVSAALVPYLSGMITGNVVVDSPLIMTINGQQSEDFGTIHGGESLNFVVHTENQGNADVFGITSTTVTNTEGVTCDDFETLTVTEAGATLDLLSGGHCVNTDPNTVNIHYSSSSGMDFPVGYLSDVTIDVTFKANAHGPYVFNGQVTTP